MITSLNRQQEYEFPGILTVISKQMYTYTHTINLALKWDEKKIIARLIFCSRKDTANVGIWKHFVCLYKSFLNATSGNERKFI